MALSAASKDALKSRREREVDVERPQPAAPARVGHPFKAALDLAEVDDRGRPSALWTGRATELGRGHIVFISRRMCYEHREMLIAVHLVDDRPVPLFGKVVTSDYDGEGQYRTTVELAKLPDTDAVQVWLIKLTPRA